MKGSIIPNVVYLGYVVIRKYVWEKKYTCKLAANIFSTLGWQNPSAIDLVKMTNQHIDELRKANKYPLKWNFNKHYFTIPCKNSASHFYYYRHEIVFGKQKKNQLN